MKRYFVDERSGIVAVKDRVYTDPDYNGLHGDTNGVIKSWSDSKYNGNHWELNPRNVLDAHDYCNYLNVTDYDYKCDTRRFICECGGMLEWHWSPMRYSVCNNA